MTKKKRKKKTQSKSNTAVGDQEQVVEPIATESHPSRIWLLFAVLVIAYVVCVGLRLTEAPYWQPSSFQVQGEKLLATHDAYFYVAGAQGTSRGSTSSLAKITAILHHLSGIKLGNIAFWFPVFLAPLAILPVVFLTWRWRIAEAGIVAGIVTGTCIGFLLRTRLGFWDNDVATLFFPSLFVVALMLWLEPHLQSWRQGVKNNKNPVESNTIHPQSFLLQAICLGLIGASYYWFRSAGESLIIAFLGLAFLLSLVLAKPWTEKRFVFLGLLIIYGVSLGSWIGLGLSLLLLLLAKTKPDVFAEKKPFLIILICLAGILFFSTGFHHKFLSNLERVVSYTKFFSAETPEQAAGLSLPTIKQSVREAQNVEWSQAVTRVAGNWWVFCLGLLGYLYLIQKRPSAILTLPLIGLALASVTLGNRFTMYGGLPMGLGLALGLGLFLRNHTQRLLIRWGGQIALCLITLYPIWNVAQSLRPAPILPKVYARTLLDIQDSAPIDARLWQWWDYGYAGQYYAERVTFGDGGNHHGDVLYPLAMVHTTQSTRQANQLIKLVTDSQVSRNATYASDLQASLKPLWSVYASDPLQELRDMGPEQAQAFVKSLAHEEKEWPDDLPPQYLTFSWENMRLAYWISYYGNWDLVTGSASPGKIQRLKGKISFKLDQGKLITANQEIPLKEMDVVTKKGTGHYGFQNQNGVYAVLNKLSNELYLMDETIYKSLMVQMLLRDPKNYDEYFELAVNRYPWARTYRVR